MKIPKELQGKEVKKIEGTGHYRTNEYYSTDSNQPEHYYKIDSKILDIYTQLFIPDMIEKYFEGWEYDNYFYKNMKQKATISFSYIENKFHSMWISNISTQIKPYTLSDFIDACLNSGITLIWGNK